MTAIHSASASLLAKRQGKEDTVRLLRTQVRGLLQKIDMDAKMKKMAELQLTVVSDPKNRKAIENQVRKRVCNDYYNIWSFHGLNSSDDRLNFSDVVSLVTSLYLVIHFCLWVGEVA